MDNGNLIQNLSKAISMKKKKMKSLTNKFLVWLLPTLGILLIALNLFIYSQNKKNQLNTTDQYCREIVRASSNEITAILKNTVGDLNLIASLNEIKSMNWETMDSLMNEIFVLRKELYGLLYIVYPDGTYYIAGKGKGPVNIGHLSHIQDVFIQKKDFSINDPSISSSTGLKKFNVAVPVKNNNGETVGCLSVNVNLSTISKISEQIKIGENGYGFICDSKGVIVAHPNKEYRMKLNLNKSDSLGFEGLSTIGKRMSQKDSGTEDITLPDGTKKIAIFDAIKDSPGWYLCVVIPKDYIYKPIIRFTQISAVLFFITLVIIFVIVFFLTRHLIAKPISKLLLFVTNISQGDLTQEKIETSNDEVGLMAENLKVMNDKLKDIVKSIILDAESMVDTSQQFNTTSQNLSEGATEQAGNLEEVSSTMEEITSTINQNTEAANKTAKITEEASVGIKEIFSRTDESINANKAIAEKITIINTIASATGLLAINASIEASKAGEQGKGFSVVANEVRELSINSKTAADVIIELATSNVELSQKIGDIMSETIPKFENVFKLIKEIAVAENEQSAGVNQINNAIQQLNAVTQTTASSSEQLAANATELSDSAMRLRKMVAYFKV